MGLFRQIRLKPGSVSDREVGELVGGGFFLHFHVFHIRPGGTFVCKFHEFVDGVLRALGNGLDPAVGKVFYPTRHAEVICGASRGVPKKHTLYFSRNGHVDAFSIVVVLGHRFSFGIMEYILIATIAFGVFVNGSAWESNPPTPVYQGSLDLKSRRGTSPYPLPGVTSRTEPFGSVYTGSSIYYKDSGMTG